MVIIRRICISFTPSNRITAIRSPKIPNLRIRPSLSSRSSRVIHNNFGGLSFDDTARRCSIKLPRHQGTIRSKRRHSRYLLLGTHRLCSIAGKVHSHIPLHGLNTGFRFLILELFTFELFIEEGIFLLLTLGTFLPGGLSIHGTVYALSHILEEGIVRGISDYSTRGIGSSLRTKRSERMEARCLRISNAPSDAVLRELLLVLIVKLVKFRCIGLRLTRANKTKSTADSATNCRTPTHNILLLTCSGYKTCLSIEDGASGAFLFQLSAGRRERACETYDECKRQFSVVPKMKGTFLGTSRAVYRVLVYTEFRQGFHLDEQIFLCVHASYSSNLRLLEGVLVGTARRAS